MDLFSVIAITPLDHSKLWLLIGAVTLSYFIGNISPAILIGKAAGLDIRKKGSGNAGTTNVLRTLGKKAAAATLVIDILKGVVAVRIGWEAAGDIGGLLCGLAVFIGHIWPVAFGFKGGKGIATGFGVVFTVDPQLGFTILIVALLGILLSKRVSVGSVLAALVLPFGAYYLVPYDLSYTVWAAVLTIIVVVKHRANIGRIIRGEEPKLSFKKSED